MDSHFRYILLRRAIIDTSSLWSGLNPLVVNREGEAVFVDMTGILVDRTIPNEFTHPKVSQLGSRAVMSQTEER